VHHGRPTNESGEVPRLALNVGEACKALGVSWETWQRHIASEVKIVRLGRRKLIAVAELERWLAASGERMADLLG
jgi:excisionase family DNA binding protein